MPTEDFDGPTAYRLEFHNTNYQGVEWSGVVYEQKATHKRYAMNIHYLQRTSGEGGGGSDMIPMVVDPDTGNMGAQP